MNEIILHQYCGHERVEIKLYYSRASLIGVIVLYRGDDKYPEGYYFLSFHLYSQFWNKWNSNKQSEVIHLAEKLNGDVIDNIKILE